MGRQEERRGFRSSEELNSFLTHVRQHLRALGFDAAARRIEGIQSAVFTTGTEWMTELRIALSEIRAGNKLPNKLDQELERLHDAVV